MNKILFKKIDFWLQTTLILICFSSFLIHFSGLKYLSEISFASFFLIGFCQVISAIINFFWLKIHSEGRKFWQTTSSLFLFLILVAISYFIFYSLDSINNNFLIILVINFLTFALFFSPILAIWYLIITWLELGKIEKSE